MRLLPNRRRRRVEPPQRPVVSRPPSPLPDPADAPRAVPIADDRPDVRIPIEGTRGGELVIKGGDPFGRSSYVAPKPSDEADAIREGGRALLAIRGMLDA